MSPGAVQSRARRVLPDITATVIPVTHYVVDKTHDPNARCAIDLSHRALSIELDYVLWRVWSGVQAPPLLRSQKKVV